jgi:hypothetical protein
MTTHTANRGTGAFAGTPSDILPAQRVTLHHQTRRQAKDALIASQ